MDELPAFMDRRPNGRARAYWMAHSKCPGGRIPHIWAEENMHKYLAKAQQLDKEEGICTPARGLQNYPKPGVRRRCREPDNVLYGLDRPAEYE